MGTTVRQLERPVTREEEAAEGAEDEKLYVEISRVEAC